MEIEFLLRPRTQSEPLIRHDDRSVDLVRARASVDDARFRLRLSGAAGAVDGFVRRHRSRFLVLTPPAAPQVA